MSHNVLAMTSHKHIIHHNLFEFYHIGNNIASLLKLLSILSLIMCHRLMKMFMEIFMNYERKIGSEFLCDCRKVLFKSIVYYYGLLKVCFKNMINVRVTLFIMTEYINWQAMLFFMVGLGYDSFNYFKIL